MQTEQHMCWSGMTDTEHNTTSGSNKEDQIRIILYSAEERILKFLIYEQLFLFNVV